MAANKKRDKRKTQIVPTDMEKAQSKRQPKQKPQPTSELSSDLAYYQKHLIHVHSVITTVCAAIDNENAEHGPDFASTLRRCAMDPLCDLIEKMGPLDDML